VGKQAMVFVQSDERLQQPVAHVGAHRRGSLASTHQMRGIQIDGDDFGEGAAEVDENSQ
jgi:hypothetical protein